LDERICGGTLLNPKHGDNAPHAKSPLTDHGKASFKLKNGSKGYTKCVFHLFQAKCCWRPQNLIGLL